MTLSSPYLRVRRTKIVATLGPATSNREMITRLFEKGADVFRLNFSHGRHEDHARTHAIIREVEKEQGRPIGILADLQGPKLRVGVFENGKVTLKAGDRFRLDLEPAPGNEQRVCLPHPEIIETATVGSNLLLDDGKMQLVVRESGKDFLETEVVFGGTLSNHKGVNVPDVVLPIPALTEKDRKDLEYALTLGVDFVALSFVQRPDDVREVRKLVQDKAWIVVKLEKPQALEQLEQIIELTDTIMVARGDLGVELPPEKVPLVQKRIIRTARAMGKPVIVATQMLESMISSPTPTRAEASDVATAVFDGADAVMLSAESAVGQYPTQAVDIMHRIISHVEGDVDWARFRDFNRQQPRSDLADAMAVGIQAVAETLHARLIVAYTQSGLTPLRIARMRPGCPILGITYDEVMARRLTLAWGVHAQPITAKKKTIEHIVEQAMDVARHSYQLRAGDSVVVASCGAQVSYTNTMQVITIS